MAPRRAVLPDESCIRQGWQAESVPRFGAAAGNDSSVTGDAGYGTAYGPNSHIPAEAGMTTYENRG